MEKISSILDNVKERLKSPLIFSFIISWIFVNWKISVALIWYDPPKNSQGHLSLIDFISSQINLCNSIIWPTTLAIAYTSLSPIIKNCINALYTWASKWGDNWSLEISKESKVSMEKFISLHQSLAVKSNQLQDLFDKESKTNEVLDQTRDALLDEKQKHQKAQEQLAELRNVVDSLYRTNILDGNWKKTSKNETGDQLNDEVLQITNATFHFRGSGRQDQYQIHNFIFDIKIRSLQFVLSKVSRSPGDNKTEYAFQVLTFESEDYFTGWEYKQGGRFQIEYKRSQIK